MDVVDEVRDGHARGQVQVRALILLAANSHIGAVSISNLSDAPAIALELQDEAARHGVVLTAPGAQRIVARRR